MSKKPKVGAYPPEFRAQMLELVARGRQPSALAREFGVDASTIRGWNRQAAVDKGQSEGLTTDERAELIALRKENRRLVEEREILKKFAAWSAQEGNWTPGKRSGS